MPESSPDSALQQATTIAGNAVGDLPTSDDSLGFGPYVEAIAAFLTSPATRPPLTMSIEGEWGSGKSSFMLQLEQAIRGPSKATVLMQHFPRVVGGLKDHGSVRQALWLSWRQSQRITIQFNAWRHDKQDALWAAFALKFTKSLRKQIGLFRGWRGDLQLFLSRLKGLRGWLELMLLVFSMVLLLLGLIGVYRFVKIHNANEVKQIIADLINTDVKRSSDKNKDAQPATGTTSPATQQAPQLGQPYQFLFSHGRWGIWLALAFAGTIRFKKYLKFPLSIHLEKYLAKPDYQGRVAFIESFHEDFGRLVKAYAGTKRIFVFIDDLDRCDVPRAAELMQAINLMIGSTGQLIFILGMDREKVAAGIAQKYKDLLQFVPQFSSSASSDQNQLSPLYFGYSYLEKFIQLSFTLPILSDTTSVTRFLLSFGKRRAASTWNKRLLGYWLTQAKRLANFRSGWLKSTSGAPSVGDSSQAGAVGASETAVARERRVKYLRVKVEGDSARVLNIASAMSGIFENNPRKLKQFVNTFRLALFLASNQGVLDEEEGCRAVTPEQVGKFAAMTLRFPDLKMQLLSDPDLLLKIQNAAQAQAVPPEYGKWLSQPGVRDAVLYGVQLGMEPFDEIYSLKDFPVKKLLSILPNIPERSPADETLPQFQVLAKRYEEIRATEKASNTRTTRMTKLFQEARDIAKSLAPASSLAAFTVLSVNPSDGSRLIAIAIAAAHRHQSCISWLLQALDHYRSWFEHYNCIRTLLGYEQMLSTSDLEFIATSLNRHWDDIVIDPGRAGFAGKLRSMAEEKVNKKRSSVGEKSSGAAS